MKTYYGNYLGVVITGGEKDPEGRGRCQVFIPHIMPALYDGWNKSKEDISFDIIGDGLPAALSPDIVTRLQQMLPWAECAAPIVGASPSAKGGNEEIRNVASSSTTNSLAESSLSDVNLVDGGAANSLTSAAAAEKTASLRCGESAKDILTGVFGLTNVPGANGQDWGNNFESLTYKNPQTGQSEPAFQKIRVSSPAEAPSNSFLVYTSDTRLGKSARNKGGGLYGHVEYKGESSSGEPVYIFGRGEVNRPGGSVLDNFTGYAYVPSTPLTNNALNKLGLPPINPSSVGGAADINMTPDGEYTGSYEVGEENQSQNSSSTSTGNNTGYSDNELLYAMRIAASETGAGVLDPSYVYDQATNKSKAIANTYFNEYKKSGLGVDAFAQQKISSGTLDWKKIDIGYVQSNGYNKAQNHGSYSDQILTTAQYVRDLSSRSGLGSEVSQSISSGDFARADQILGSKDNSLTIGTKYYGLYDQSNAVNQLESRLKNEFNGDVTLALNGIDGELPKTPDITELSSGQFTPEQLAKSNVVTRHPTQHSRNDGPDTNYQALGMFGYASEGTAVWVFFREGNPLCPVYFAASYGQREWKNMYQYASSSIGAGAGPGGAFAGTEKMRLNSYGGGFESAQITDASNSGVDSNFTFQVYGKNGSNLLFTKDHTEFNSTYNHNQRVSGDYHEITEANREKRVRGDDTSYIEQDVYITIGNWSDEAIAASDEIQQYINEAMEIKSKVGSSS